MIWDHKSVFGFSQRNAPLVSKKKTSLFFVSLDDFKHNALVRWFGKLSQNTIKHTKLERAFSPFALSHMFFILDSQMFIAAVNQRVNHSHQNRKLGQREAHSCP